MYTAVSRKAVGKSARDNPERYCGWFLVHCFSKKFQRMAREAMDICLWVLKESNKSRFDSYSVNNKCIDHIPYYLSVSPSLSGLSESQSVVSAQSRSLSTSPTVTPSLSSSSQNQSVSTSFLTSLPTSLSSSGSESASLSISASKSVSFSVSMSFSVGKRFIFSHG